MDTGPRTAETFAQEHMTKVVELGFEPWQSTAEPYSQAVHHIVPSGAEGSKKGIALQLSCIIDIRYDTVLYHI